MTIALDAMGGDFAPEAIVEGAVWAAQLMQEEILLVGVPDRIRSCFRGTPPPNIRIHPASEVVEMHEKPTEALRKKRDSSISVAANLVKTGEAVAMVSAGNTGAATAAALLSWRQISGVHRPAIASVFPRRNGQFLLLDAGASPDVDPEHLVEFALMGLAYAERVMGKKDPKAHLLNIGEEPGKGNAFAKQAYDMMARYPWFAGNLEPKAMFHAECDVLVCDAFVGNMVLKTSEGVAEYIVDEIRGSVPTGPGRFLFLPMKAAMAPLRRKLDYAEYGGSPLLGLNGICVIGHGRSNPKAIKNALMIAARAAEHDLVGKIRESLSQLAEGAAV
ncbi:MAG: phosphate acyltransferase PlsX [Fimbriimonadaceae bacterium]|nr:phosphate acyltransferase PlsX [Fimbriimonadaceae bacterium]QYK56369.1 MAG: phosphate acyltransferase PlsX [Fimbriimonadaceae bacterium]